jgi:hypothetical protein
LTNLFLFLTYRYTGIQDPDPNAFEKLDPDPPSPKKLDPDPHKVNADPKHWFHGLSFPFLCEYRGKRFDGRVAV